MEIFQNIFEPLLKKIEQYVKTSLKLYKLKSIDKITALFADLIFQCVALLVFSVFVIFLNIAISLWLGEILGQMYFGFLSVALLYGLIWIFVLIFKKTLKNRISDVAIQKIINQLK